MPYKHEISGIYSIGTPAGNKYVGSSHNIFRRWAEHRSQLKNGKHHSARLQMAYNKHGSSLTFEVLERCRPEHLNEREQHFIDHLGAKLNTSAFVKNFWVDEKYRAKLEKYRLTEKYKEDTKRRVSASIASRGVPVECSNGVRFETMKAAATHYDTTTSHIKNLIENQAMGVLGVRFKKQGDDWLPNRTGFQIGGEKNRGSKRSDEARKKMSDAKQGVSVSALARKKATEASSVPVVGTNLKTLERVYFPCQRAAAREINPNHYKTASAQICKAIKGIKKSAYGFSWSVLNG